LFFTIRGGLRDLRQEVSHGSLFGFVEVEELVFGERSACVDPAEEKVKLDSKA